MTCFVGGQPVSPRPEVAHDSFASATLSHAVARVQKTALTEERRAIGSQDKVPSEEGYAYLGLSLLAPLQHLLIGRSTMTLGTNADECLDNVRGGLHLVLERFDILRVGFGGKVDSEVVDPYMRRG